MNLKIIFGVIVPALIIVFITILGSLGSIDVKKGFVTKIALTDIFRDGRIVNSIKIGDIYLENDYFLSQRYEFPSWSACLNDKEGVLQRIAAGNIQYSEGDYEYEPEQLARSVVGSTDNVLSVEVKANDEKKISIYLQPAYNIQYGPYGNSRNYTELLKDYGGYDELVIFELEDNYGKYNYYDASCNVNEDELEDADRIPITSG
ncbi:hypothetical protein HYV49_00575 [Candidatus Pacearchaeota archaeon]|nr:hypothetical protein [Candidatus Pacearchaeota archaeon]